jgi:hypothetical protein
MALLLTSNVAMWADEMDTFTEWQGKYQNFLKDNGRPLFESYQRRLVDMEKAAAGTRNYGLAARIKEERLAAAKEAGVSPTEATVGSEGKVLGTTATPPPVEGILTFPPTSAEVGGGVSLNVETGALVGWTSESSYAKWSLPGGLKTGGYEVEITYSCKSADNAGGGAFVVKEDVYHLRHEVRDTGSWDTFQSENCGTLRLKSTSKQFVLTAAVVKGAGLFQVKQVRLKPVASQPVSNSP